MTQDLEKYLRWQIGNLEEYKLALERRGMRESVETIYHTIEGVRQFLDNPKMIDAI